MNKSCYYCGEPATTEDHTIPRTVLSRDTHADSRIRKLIVPACFECNVLLGSKVFDTLKDRRDYVQGRLEQRYRTLLDMPEWRDKEIVELSSNLQGSIRASLDEAARIRKRVQWNRAIVSDVLARKPRKQRHCRAFGCKEKDIRYGYCTPCREGDTPAARRRCRKKLAYRLSKDELAREVEYGLRKHAAWLEKAA